MKVHQLAFTLLAASIFAVAAAPLPVHASGVCGNAIVEPSDEECDPGGGLFFDGNPALGTCTTGTDCFFAFSCCKFNCQFVGQGATCFDGEECTINDLCNQVGHCVGDAVPAGTACDDDAYCTLVDQCNAQGQCIGNGDPCAGGSECNDTCNESDLSCFSPQGSACGDPGATECTQADACDGQGSCDANDVPAGTPAPVQCDDGNGCSLDECDGTGGCRHVAAGAGTACGDPGDSECGNPDTCDAAGSCVGNDEPAGTPCGDPADTQCSDPDTCNGSGQCLDNDAASGTPAVGQCGDANDCTLDICNGVGGCSNPPAAAGASCGDASSDECTAADSCDGAGVCLTNDAAAGTPAPLTCSDANSCTLDACDGAGGCQYTNETAGVPCGDPADTECSAPDSCDGDGACIPNDATAGISCGDPSFTDCTMPDSCDGSGSCSTNDLPDGMSCEDFDFCTVNDTCSGGACSGGEARLCPDDGNHCTHDFCDSGSAACVHAVEPKPFCHDAGIGQIVLINKDDDSKDKLKWKWIRGLPVDFLNVGDPTTDTEFELCLFDTQPDDGPVLTSRLLVPPSSAWKVLGDQKGFKYLDVTRSVGGVKLVKLKTGEKPKFGLKAERENLELPEPVLAPDPESKGQYFFVQPMFNAQLVGSTGECWTADFDTVKKNTGQKFKSRRRGVVIK